MKRRTVSFAVVVLLSATACYRQHLPAPRPDALPRPDAARDLAEENLAKLQGTGRIESSSWNGVPEPDAARTVTVLFRGGRFIVVDKDGNRQEETIRLMPDQYPKAIDCWSKGGGRPAPGIYALEGDRLMWCSAGTGTKVRPATFASKPGSKHSLMILRRQKS